MFFLTLSFCLFGFVYYNYRGADTIFLTDKKNVIAKF